LLVENEDHLHAARVDTATNKQAASTEIFSGTNADDAEMAENHEGTQSILGKFGLKKQAGKQKSQRRK